MADYSITRFPDASDGYDLPTTPMATFDPNTLPKFNLQPQQPAPSGGLIGNAVSAGYHDLLNSYANAASALGAATNNTGLANAAAAYGQQQAQAGEPYKDQALETAPWNPGGSWANLPRQIPYQIAKQIPNVGATLAGAGAGALAGSALGPVGSVVGGALGAFGATYPQSVGSIYGEALDKNGGKPNAEAAKEAGLYGVPHALLDTGASLLPVGMFGKAATQVGEMTVKQAAKTILKDTAKEVLAEGSTEGAQRVIELTQRPDMTLGQKANSVIENAFFGAMAGGGMGGIASSAGTATSQVLRATRQLDASQVTPETIKEATATAAPTQGDQQRAAEAQQVQEQQIAQQQIAQQVAPQPQVEGEVSFAPPELQQEPPAQPQREYTPERQFAGFSDQELVQGLEAAQRKNNEGIANLIRQEQAARVNDVQAQDVERERIRAEDQAFENNKARRDVLDKAGLKSNERGGVVSKFNYLDDMQLADQVQEELKKENPSPSVTKLASYLGLRDEAGKEHDLSARLEAAHMALDKAPTEEARYKVSKDLEKLSRQFDLQQRMSDREQPAEVATEVKGSVLDAAQERASELSGPNAKRFLDGVQKALDGGIEPVRAGSAKEGWKFASDLLSKQAQPTETAEAPTAQPTKLSDQAEQLLESTKDQELPTVMMSGRVRQIFQSEGVYDPNLSGGEMIQRLREKQAGVSNGQSTNAASGGNDVGNVGNVQGSPAGPAVEGQVGPAVQGQPVRQEGQVGPAPGEGQDVSAQGQSVRESGQQGVWTSGGKTESVQISPEVRKLGNGKQVRKVTTASGKTYYVPADKVSVGGPSASPVSALIDSTTPSPPPAVDTSAPGERPSAPGTRRESVASETSSAPRSAVEMSRKVEGVLQKVTGSLTADRIRRLVRQGTFYAASLDHISEEWGQSVPEVADFVASNKLGESVRMRSAASQMPVFEQYDRLSAAQQRALETVLNAEAELEILPLEKSWYDAHEHIIESPDLTPGQKARLKNAWGGEEMRAARRTVNGSPEAKALYDAFHQLNDAAMHEWNAVSLLKLLDKMSVPGLPEPHVDFQMKEDISDTPESLKTFWEGEKNKAFLAAKNYIDQLTKAYEDPNRDEAEKKVSKKFRDVLQQKMAEIFAMEQKAKKVPYSHLGRFGDQVVSFHFPTIKEGDKEVVDPSALRKVSEAFEKSGLEISVNPNSTQKYAFMRFETVEDRNAAAEIVQKLQKMGAIKDEKGTYYFGPRDNLLDMGMMSSAEKAMLESALADVKEDNAAFSGVQDESVKAAREQLEKMLRDMIIDSLPDSNIRKVMVSRKRVTGASSDMIRAAAHRFEVNNVAIASMIAGPKALRALKGLKDKSKSAGAGQLEGSLTTDDATLYQQLHHELAMRHLQAGKMANGNNVTEVIKALTFTGAMGANVSTALMQGLSVATLGLPRLGAQSGVGMVRAARALTKAMSPTSRILAASLSDAIFNNPSKLGDVVITRATLEKAGFDPDSRQAKFIMRVINSGIIEMGTLARDLGAIVANKQSGTISNVNMVLRWANAMNQYMEVASRLTMAFASLEVHNAEKHGDLYEFTSKNITNSLFDFSNNNAGRLFNRSASGPTRLATTFMSYPAMWLQLLIREGEKSIWGKDKETKAQAREFLGMHFGMMAALAGISGLPFTAPLAMALNAMFGSDDEPFDAENAVRKYLTMWFGKDVGDIAMRGLPRAFGVDISSRIGGQDLMPFSQFLADQRGWKESTQALIGRGLGAPASVFMNMMGGLDKIHGGDVWGGMKELLPRGIHNMMDAVDLAGGEPYRDTKGHAIPGEPGAGAALLKSVGFKSGTESDWSDKRRVNDAYEKQLRMATAPIISGFTQAATRGDYAAMKSYLERANEFATKHPEFNIHKQMVSAVKGEFRSSSREQATNLPRAVDLKDPQLMDMLSWSR